MNILLAKPDNISDHIQPSIGLGILAEILRKSGHSVQLLDFLKDKINFKNFITLITPLNIDIIGFQCYTFDIYIIKKYVELIRKFLPSTKIILGGPHPTTLPEETLIFFANDIDYIFLGESEISLKLFCAGESVNNIKGIGYRDKSTGDIVYSYPEFNDNIDEYGMPAWDLIKPETYPPAQHGAFYKKFPIAPIIMTRGCPFPCTFCAGNLIMGKKIRKRSVNLIIEEIKYLYHHRGIREFHFVDDNFTMDKNYVMEFLKELKKLQIDISWATPNGVRMDSLDDEMLVLMKETGLYLISLGIESGSDRILKLMKKGNTVEKIKKYIKIISNHDIDIAGFFILGYPGETIDDIKQTITFSLKLPLIRANYFTFLPFPGTEIYNQLKKSGELDSINSKKFFFTNATYPPEGISRNELKSLQRGAFIKFFIRPSILIKNIMAIRSFLHFKYLGIRFYHWFFY